MTDYILAAYMVAGLPVARQAAGWCLWYDVDVSDGRRPGANEKWWAFAVFVVAFFTWPLWIIGAIWNAKSVAILPVPAPVKIKLQRDEMRRLEEINAEQERRLGLGRSTSVEPYHIERPGDHWR